MLLVEENHVNMHNIVLESQIIYPTLQWGLWTEEKYEYIVGNTIKEETTYNMRIPNLIMKMGVEEENPKEVIV